MYLTRLVIKVNSKKSQLLDFVRYHRGVGTTISRFGQSRLRETQKSNTIRLYAKIFSDKSPRRIPKEISGKLKNQGRKRPKTTPICTFQVTTRCVQTWCVYLYPAEVGGDPRRLRRSPGHGGFQNINQTDTKISYQYSKQ